MKLSMLDNQPDLSSYDQLSAGRSYAFGEVAHTGQAARARVEPIAGPVIGRMDKFDPRQ